MHWEEIPYGLKMDDWDKEIQIFPLIGFFTGSSSWSNETTVFDQNWHSCSSIA